MTDFDVGLLLTVFVPVAAWLFFVVLRLLVWAVNHYRSLPKDDGKAYQYLRGKASSGLGLAPSGVKGLPPNNHPTQSRASSPSDPLFEGLLVYGVKGHGFDEHLLYRGL